MVLTLHMASIYAFLPEFPGVSFITLAHLTRLKHLLYNASKSMELRHTIHLIEVLTSEIDEIEASINTTMDSLNSPITTIPGLKNCMSAMILAEVGDFSRFDSANQLSAYTELSPSTYQSGQLMPSHSRMEMRGLKYLHYALFNATQYVCLWNLTFKAYIIK